MPRFQLLVRELGKPPRVVPLTRTITVGRSRRADLVLEDEEVGREQFRIGPEGALLFVEGVGSTNRTVVDGIALEPGQRATVNAGAVIKVGRSSVQVQAEERAPAPPTTPPRASSPDATLAAPLAPPRARADDTTDMKLPGNTLDVQRPRGGAAAPPPASPAAPPPAPAPAPPPAAAPAPAGEALDRTMDVRGAFRPGRPASPPPTAPPPAAPPPAPPPPPAASADDGGGMTIQVKGVRRPGAGGPSAPPPARPPSASPPPPPAAPAPPPAAPPVEEPSPTLMPRAFRPGAGAAPAAPSPAKPPPPPPPAPPPAPAAAEPRRAPASPAPAPAPAADAAAPPKPKTVFVDPAEMVPSTTITPALAADVEARLHQAMPRVFVKGETLKRRVRLMKARTKLGRAETVDVLLPHESVSELHAEIEFDGQGFVLRDCGSTNGTLVDGDVVRGGARAIGRNTLLGFGSLRCLFVCVDPATAAADRRHEERALRTLIATGQLTKDVKKQVLTIVRSDTSQTIGEVLLAETTIEPADWTAAIAATRGRTTLFDRVRRWFTRAPARPR